MMFGLTERKKISIAHTVPLLYNSVKSQMRLAKKEILRRLVVGKCRKRDIIERIYEGLIG